MGKRSQQRYTDGKKAYEKTLNIICHSGTANQNNDAPTHLLKWLKSKTLTIPSTRKDVEKQLSFFCWWECKIG